MVKVNKNIYYDIFNLSERLPIPLLIVAKCLAKSFTKPLRRKKIKGKPKLHLNMFENTIVLLQTFIPSCCEASTAARSKSSFGKSESWQVEDSAGVVEVGGGVVVVVVVVQLYPNSSSSEVVPEK